METSFPTQSYHWPASRYWPLLATIGQYWPISNARKIVTYGISNDITMSSLISQHRLKSDVRQWEDPLSRIPNHQ